MSATSCPPSRRVTYSGGKTLVIKSLSTAVLAEDFELAFMTTVLPPERLAATTPRVRSMGKLKGLMTRVTP